MIFVKIVPKTPETVIPKKSTDGSAAFDVYSPRDFSIGPRSSAFIPLNFSLEIREGCCGVLSHRSGLNKNRGIQAYGVIDSDYRGEVGITLFNTREFTANFKKGDRIGQIMFLYLPTTVFQVVENLSTTERGEGGHGSTGLQ